MFRQVFTENEKKIFISLWEEACIEKGYEMEPFNPDSSLYLILNSKDNPIGTLECIPYLRRLEDELFCFQLLDLVKRDPSKVFIIDKVCLTKKERGANIRKVFDAIYNYSKLNNYSYGIALLEPNFYRSLKIFYKLPINRVTKEKLFYKGDYVVPSIIDIEMVRGNFMKYEWMFNNVELNYVR